METTIVLEPRDALYNAALVGLYHVLMHHVEKKNDNEAKKIIENCAHGLEIPLRLMEGLETSWVDYAIETCREDCAFTSLCSKYDVLMHERNHDKSYVDNIKALRSDMKKKLKSNSYKSAYKICDSNGDSFDVLEYMQSLEKVSDEEFLSKITPVFEYLRRNERVFLMKDIAYNFINQYWTNKAFLNKQKNEKDIEQCILDDIVTPIINWSERTKTGSSRCMCCNSDIDSKQRISTAWISDLGVDDARKQSNFYNFVPDTYICPICALAYSCLPFGFNIVGGQGVFINAGSDLKKIIAINRGFELDHRFKDISDLDRSQFRSPGAFYYYRLRAYAALCDNLNAKEQIGSVQVIQRRKKNNEPYYVIEQISRPQLSVLTRCADEFNRLIKWNIKRSESDYINLFAEATDNLMQGRNQYALMDTVMRIQLANNKPFSPIADILKIQCFMHRKEDNMNFSYKISTDAFKYAETAARIKAKLSAGENGNYAEREASVNNKLRGYIYKLLNQLNSRNFAGFADSLARMHISIGEPLPTEMMVAMMKSEDNFKTFGMAYLYGLGGNIIKKDEKNDKNDKNEEDK